jgi:hypothetical protein
MTRDLLGGSSASAVLTIGPIGDSSASDLPATRHFTQSGLARRWRVSDRTLELWRRRKIGPPHLKVGRVAYRLADVLAFEKARLLAPSLPAGPFFTRNNSRSNQ